MYVMFDAGLDVVESVRCPAMSEVLSHNLWARMPAIRHIGCQTWCQNTFARRNVMCFVVLSVQMFGDCQMSELMSDNMSGYLLLTLSKKMSVHNCFISFWTCQIRGFSIWVRSASSKFGLAANKCRHAGEDDLPTRARSVMIATNTSANNALAPKMLLDTEGSAWRDVCWYESQSAAMYQWLNIHIAWNTLNKQRFRVFSCNQHTENKMVYLYSKCQQTRGCFN